MSFLADKYAVYVIAAYGATALILGWLLWSSLSASARARRELGNVERERER
ncbi:MAG: heme exporter protein CcmD [Paracoccaceae bacterium]|nr:heme exporter protein CcmD [Paracoccaceae bacterium]